MERELSLLDMQAFFLEFCIWPREVIVLQRQSNVRNLREFSVMA